MLYNVMLLVNLSMSYNLAENGNRTSPFELITGIVRRRRQSLGKGLVFKFGLKFEKVYELKNQHTGHGQLATKN